MSSPATEQPLPPLHERIKNARRAAQRVVTTVVKGQSIRIDRRQTELRMQVCRECEFYRSSDGTCSQCGCFIRLKARLSTEVCPEGKWDQSDTREPDPQEPGELFLDSNGILRAELDVRSVLPPESQLAQLLNQFHRDDEKEGGCKSCRRKRYLRNITVALVDFLNEAPQEQKQALRDVFPNTSGVRVNKQAVSWDAFGISD